MVKLGALVFGIELGSPVLGVEFVLLVLAIELVLTIVLVRALRFVILVLGIQFSALVLVFHSAAQTRPLSGGLRFHFEQFCKGNISLYSTQHVAQLTFVWFLADFLLVVLCIILGIAVSPSLCRPLGSPFFILLKLQVAGTVLCLLLLALLLLLSLLFDQLAQGFLFVLCLDHMVVIQYFARQKALFYFDELHG